MSRTASGRMPIGPERSNPSEDFGLHDTERCFLGGIPCLEPCCREVVFREQLYAGQPLRVSMRHPPP